MDNQNITTFQIEVFDLGEKFNEISHKGRARIFYRGKNRNGSYITEEFAGKLMASAPYTPVKGIWAEDIGDFLDHGYSRVQGRIYGVVLSNPNFAWEEHEDYDGVKRIYACVDVLIYTALYPEASQILGKPLSMELLPKSIKGAWADVDGERCFKFEEASFAGLQVLGEHVEPCFEGAQFFSLFSQLQELYTKIKDYNLQSGGTETMPMNFKFSENENFERVWAALNPNYTEEGNWTIDAVPCVLTDTHVIGYNYNSDGLFRADYSIVEDSLEMGEAQACFMLTDGAEIEALNAFIEEFGADFSAIGEQHRTLVAQEATYAATLQEKDEAYATLQTSMEALQGDVESYTARIAELEAALEVANSTLADTQQENETLKSYKLNIETEEKKAVIEKFASKLEDEVIQNYTANIDNYTVDGLFKELSSELVKATPSIFSVEVGNGLIPKDEPPSGIAAILEKYK